jgi:DNA-directed RNA polymerase specialized sigma24 family protein
LRKKSKAQLYLERVEMIDSIVNNKLIEQRQWKELALNITANMGGERVQSSGSTSKMADALNKCIDMEHGIAAAVDRLVEEKTEIVSTIEQLNSPMEYNILHMRYIQYKSLQEIADHYRRSYDWVKTTNGRAIASVQRLLEKRKEGA